MTPETWRRVEELYHAALDRAPGERAAWLEAACAGDEALYQEVGKLLAANDQAGTFLNVPPWALPESTRVEPSESLVGRTLGVYKVLATIGRGGMGEVYLAEDTRLGRKAALKVLPAPFTADPDRLRRFEQEARAATALNHPNIVTVYDIGEADVGRFLVMELVAGRTLRALAGEGVAWPALLPIGRQIAEALAVAHAAGIVHRDIKPDNVMVRDDGYVKVLDFGLARLTAAREARPLAASRFETRPGLLLGTMRYMSPEQARGEPVSGATDVFSLGLLLYELATGRHPFHADSEIGVLHGIASATPVPPHDGRADLPQSLGELLLRMLDKDPRERPSAHEVAAALSREFAIHSRHESRSAMRPGRIEPPRQGAVSTARRLPSRVVVTTLVATAALVSAAWLTSRWLNPNPAAVGGGEPASGSAPSAGESPRLSSGGPASSNAEANRYFEAAMQAIKAQGDFPRGRAMLERALEVDPRFAEARAWYGFSNWLLLDTGHSNDSTLLYNAEEEMRRALEIAPGLARAHAGFAGVYFMQGRRELMPSSLDRALKSNPDDEDALHLLMQYHHFSGAYAEAEQAGQRVLARLPLFFPTRMIMGEMRRQQGDLSGAIREQERILEQDAQNAYGLRFLARAHMDAGNLPRARAALDRIRPQDSPQFRTRLAWALQLALEGRREDAAREMDQELLKWLGLVAYDTSAAAEFYAILGDATQALDWLDRAVRAGDERAEWFRRDPLLANVHAHPRFAQILDSIAYRRQQRKAPS